MATIILTKFIPTALAPAAIGLGTLMTVGAATAHSSEKSDCEEKGGTYSETTVFDNNTGKYGTNYSCCVKDANTNTTSWTSTTVTKSSRIPVDVGAGVITAAQTVEPVPPISGVPVNVVKTDAQILPAP